MAIVINGSGTVTGLAVGGLPDDSVDAGSLANSINSEITANTAKTGITSAQATAITAALPKAGGTVTGNVIHNDNVKALFGAGADLEIYHDGAHNRLQCPTGELKLRASAVRLGSVAGENGINMVGDGAVELYHNNVKKVETTATGVTVTGAIAGATNLGKVLQVKHSSTTSSASSTNNTVTIQTITLTKISSTSKLLIKGWAYLGQKTTGASTDGANPTLTLENGSTEILKFYHSDVPMWYTSGTYNGTYDTHYYAGEVLYTIGSGSITINLKLGSSVDGVWVNRSAGASNGFGQTGITIMEIEV